MNDIEQTKFMGEAEHRFERLEKLFQQNGEHFSYFNKNLVEIKASLDGHIKRVEPMLLAYEKDAAFNKTLGEKAKTWGVRATWVAGAIGSWYVIKAFIISALK